MVCTWKEEHRIQKIGKELTLSPPHPLSPSCFSLFVLFSAHHNGMAYAPCFPPLIALPFCSTPHDTRIAPLKQFPRTTIVHTYLLGHKDFVSALAAVPGNGGVFLLSGGGDGMVGLWDAESGKE